MDTELYKCSKCNDTKPLKSFDASKRMPKGNSMCYECRRKRHLEMAAAHPKQEDGSKVCIHCKEEKHFSEFRKSIASKDGVNNSCKICTREHERLIRAKNIARYRERGREYRYRHKEVINEKQKETRNTVEYKEYMKQYLSAYKKAKAGKISSINRRRAASKLQATPKWANRYEIEKIYNRAHRMFLWLGVKYHVDHIIPLKSDLVCGLHCEANLQIITAKENLIKGNRYWQDMPERIQNV